METLINKYNDKLVNHGLCKENTPVVGGINDEIFWNREFEEKNELEKIIKGLNINSLIFAKPVSPFFDILNFYANKEKTEFVPDDTETRTFLHSIPVCNDLIPGEIIKILKRRKGVVIKDKGIITYGTVSPEQAFIVFSSIIFSGFVKFFTDYAYLKIKKQNDVKMQDLFPFVFQAYKDFLPKNVNFKLTDKKLETNAEIVNAMKEAGKAVVDARMVDSFFGNISFRKGNLIYISQTGSSMDELSGCIDICPIDNSSSTAITASSEFTSHREIYLNKSVTSILHGHPRFSVIMSMICDDFECKLRGKCHIKCPKKRFINNVPIITGEVGTGPRGLSRTLPPAMKNHDAVIVYGHGVFTAGQDNFRKTFDILKNTEQMCIDEYLRLVQ